LIEYSAKYRVSLSTLRRRIKSSDLEFRLIEGKYLIKNEALPGSIGISSQAGSETIAPPHPVSSQNQASTSPQTPPAPSVPADEYWRATESIIAEMKKAFALTLKAKDEQVAQLRDEVADLKMLVRLLEDETQKQKTALAPSFDFDLGLEA
jgi:hypothetical protein